MIALDGISIKISTIEVDARDDTKRVKRTSDHRFVISSSSEDTTAGGVVMRRAIHDNVVARYRTVAPCVNIRHIVIQIN